MKNSNYSSHRGIVRVFGKRATKQKWRGLPVMVSLFIFKNTFEKQNGLQEKKFAAGENQKRLWKIGIRGSLI